MLIDTKKIEELINSDVTDYQLGKHTGLSNVTFLRYRQGGKVENMSLRVAGKLMEYINAKDDENKCEMNNKIKEVVKSERV